MAVEQFPAAQTALEEYQSIEQQMASPEVVTNPDKMRKLGRRHAELGAIVSAYQSYTAVRDDLEAARVVDLVEEVNATLVTTALKLGVEPLVDNHLGELGAHDAGAKGEHVGVVVHAGELGAEGLGAYDGANTFDLVGSQADADAGTADQDTQVDVTVGHGLTHLVAGDGVIEALGGVGAIVHDLAAALLQVLGNDVLELDGGMVVADTNLHEWFLSGPCGGIAKGFTAFDCMIARLLRKRSGVFWSNALACNKTGFS